MRISFQKRYFFHVRDALISGHIRLGGEKLYEDGHVGNDDSVKNKTHAYWLIFSTLSFKEGSYKMILSVYNSWYAIIYR